MFISIHDYTHISQECRAIGVNLKNKTFGAEDPTLTQHKRWEFYFGITLIWFCELNTVQQWDYNRYALGKYLLVYFHSKVIQSECSEMILQHKPKHSNWWQLGILLPKHTLNLNQNTTADIPNVYCMATLKVVRNCEEGSSRQWTLLSKEPKVVMGWQWMSGKTSHGATKLHSQTSWQKQRQGEALPQAKKTKLTNQNQTPETKKSHHSKADFRSSLCACLVFKYCVLTMEIKYCSYTGYHRAQSMS